MQDLRQIYWKWPGSPLLSAISAHGSAEICFSISCLPWLYRFRKTAFHKGSMEKC